MFNHVNLDHNLQELECETLPTGRTYKTPDGNKYPSVTTVLGEQSKAGIIAWRKRIGEEEANKISSQAATRGTAVHTLAENYINNDADWSKGAMPANLFSFNQIKTILDTNMNNVYAQEVPLYSDQLKVAGRVDLIAEWGGQLAIVDFKTSRKPKQEKYIQNYFMRPLSMKELVYPSSAVLFLLLLMEKSHNYLSRSLMITYKTSFKFEKHTHKNTVSNK
jgi:hypothetical protein